MTITYQLPKPFCDMNTAGIIMVKPGIPDENFERVTHSKIAKWVCPLAS